LYLKGRKGIIGGKRKGGPREGKGRGGDVFIKLNTVYLR